MTRVEIGVWDWLRPDWLMAYYPSDLPVDWRPAYYANDYACVGLPASSWTPADLSRWSEETGETLVYWLGCGPGQLASQDLAGVLKALGRQLAGICFEAVEPAAARELMNVLRRTVPSAGYAADPPLPGVGAPWRAERADRPAALGIYRPMPGDDVRKRRALLESFATVPGPVERCLLVDGPPTIVDECRALCVMLGL